MEAKRQCVAALLEANVAIKDIMEQEDMSRGLVYKVKNLVKEGKPLSCKEGSGRQQKAQ